jgi:tetratricopeptide (TPR) repeat protein
MVMKKTNQNESEVSVKKEEPGWKNSLIDSSYLKTILIIIAFFALGFLTYANTFESPFVFDDGLRITDNPAIRLEELTVHNLWNAAFSRYSARSRPVGNISFALNYYFHQYEPAGYHLFNIIVHIASGILLWLFLKMTLGLTTWPSGKKGGEWIALAAALLWLVNPVQTQSVTYIVQRLNSMAAMFFLLAFICYLKGRLTASRGRMWAWYLAAVSGWLLALGCKQNTATLPFFIILYEWFFFQELSVDWLKRNLKYFVIVVVVFTVVALIFLGTKPIERLTSISDFADKEFTVVERAMTQFRVVVYYLSLIIFPHPSRQNLDYDFPLSYSLLNPATTLLSLFGIIGLTALGILLARKQRLISFCIFWFLGNLVIESSVIPIAIIFEHRVYLPSMLVWLVPIILISRYRQSRRLIVGLGCTLPVLALFSYWTFERNKVWRDAVTLWQDCVKKSPQKGRTYANLAAAQKRQGLVDEAKENFRKALALNPDLEEAHHNLGVILDEKGQSIEAIEHYRQAIELKPDMVPARNNLGAALLAQGNTDEAVEHLLKALQWNPEFSELYNNLGLARFKQGNITEAIGHYSKAVQLDPDSAEAHFNLGVALSEQGKNKEGIQHIQKALALNPDYAEAHNNLGGQLLSQGNIDDALVHINRALAINPELAEAHNNLGIIMIRQGKLDAAISHFQNAVRLQPDFTLAQNNLARALAISGSKNLEIAGMKKELAARPDDPALHYKLANLYLGQRELNRAIIEFEKALALQPGFLAAQNNLAMALAADGQYDRALNAFEKLTALDPDNAGNYYNVAVLHALQNQVPQSIAWLKKALERGYRNWELIKTDPDLTNIRDSQDYKQLVQGH